MSAKLAKEYQSALKEACGVDNILVYRELKEKTGMVEFTIYFDWDGDRHRLDLEEKVTLLSSTVAGVTEWYMTGRVVQAILTYKQDRFIFGE